jgi:glycosyltransferase involved in cell wall biosynthesis
MRILYLIHGHERFSKGGAEAAAFSLFHSIKNLPDCDCWILAAFPTVNDAIPFGALQSADKYGREYIIGAQCEYFYLKSIDIAAIKPALARLLDEVQPDIIHLHHFINFGIDILPLMQTLMPTAKIIVTLHEYLALCLNNGQMVTTKRLSLCKEPSPLSCLSCFPDKNQNNIFLRLSYAATTLKGVDQLISPSHFLMERYKQSGINHPRFECIENGLPIDIHQSENENEHERSKLASKNSLNRFSFFGQINQYKGLLILLKAVAMLKQSDVTNFLVIINGANLEMQPMDFQKSFGDLLEQAGDLVLMAGSYNKDELKSRMIHSDWTILPSIWWENSPVVIQESFYFKRPVIGSNIGGISEKIRGKGGIEFEVANPLSLANTIESCINNDALHQQLQQQMQEPFTAEHCAQRHRQLYLDLMNDIPASP